MDSSSGAAAKSRKKPEPPPPTLESFYPSVDKYLGRLGDHTRRSYQTILVAFMRFAASHGVTDARKVDESLAEKYYRFVLTRGNASGNISAVRQIFEYYRDQKIFVGDNPLHRRFTVTRNWKPNIATILSGEEVQALLDSFDTRLLREARDHAIIATIFYTCSRAEEVSNLRRRDYNGRFISFPKKQMPVHPVLKESLDQYLSLAKWKRDDYLFQSFIGGKSPASIRFSGKKFAGKSLRIMTTEVASEVLDRPVGVTPDVLRDSAIAIYLNNGGNLRTVMAVAGQRSLRFIMRFMDLRGDVTPTLDDILRIRT